MLEEQTPNTVELAHAARSCEGFLAGPLVQFQQEHHLSDEQLARLVGCPTKKLTCLALCHVPKSQEEAAVIAAYVDGDLEKLTAWLETTVCAHSTLLNEESEEEPYVVDEVYDRGEHEVLGLNVEDEEEASHDLTLLDGLVGIDSRFLREQDSSSDEDTRMSTMPRKLYK